MNRRADLAVRQQDVLRSLLQGDVPAGFDPRSASMTISVLRTKRRSEVSGAIPGLRDIPDFAARFDAWAAENPRRGCAHHDAVDFLAHDRGALPEPFASIRALERVYRRQAIIARDRRPGQRRWAVAIGPRVWHLGPRTAN